MSKTKKFQLIYQVEAERTEQVIRLIFELKSNTGMQPEQISLPGGTVIPWNEYAAHQFAAEGHITEAEFIEMSMNSK
jgi:diaminopimelate decarboxylase